VSRRVHIRHEPIAEGLRALPGQWGEVGNYQWRGSAQSAIRCILAGVLPSCQPAGAFEAEIRLDSEGDAHVWARYVGAQEVAA
jgi:hypothetical protein